MSSARPTWLARLVLVLLLLALSGTSVAIWLLLERNQAQRVQERVDTQAQALAQQLEGRLSEQLQDLRVLAALWNQRGRLPREEWDLYVRFCLDGFGAYQSIQWVGADLHMRWLLPVQGNEAALGFQLNPEHPNYPLAMDAKASGQPRFSDSFALLQGGRGLILYTPLYLRDASGQQQFDGFLQGVFRVERLLDELLDDLGNRHFNLRLLEHDTPVYRRETDAWQPRLQQQVPLQLLGNPHFTLQLSPTEELLQQLDSPLPSLVLGSGLAISLLLVAACALALDNARRAAALQLGNQRLNQEIQQREVVEQILRDSRERLQLVVDMTDASPDGLFIIDPASREVLHMNRATYASLGYSAEQFAALLKDDPERVLPGFHAWLQHLRAAQQDDDPSALVQREMRRSDGSRQAAEINAQLVQVNDHDYLIGISRDNSERLQLEAKLQRLSKQDGLTGLYNRRYFDRQLLSEWRRLSRTAQPMALLMLDIDHFKAYNDALGHLAGDDALRRVAKVLQGCMQREGDAACRYGGEEFALILTDTDLEGAEHVAARVLQLVAELGLEHPGSPLGRLSLSIGLTATTPSAEQKPKLLIERSDQALYRAKHEGRNRACTWQAGRAG
ncbi:diguanylate cyclase [Pseudomonas sp. UL073]|uniref:diguanylate cyclase n=1 Tax=Zestomonas insulae TaxID=2809017 RepID=A0ABS2IML0_9GAMM|nr:diguanylate cyclase [Pseudomonas insulae]MBM7063232.1 diguanylate cyclase [Pseudomonas insulae]